MSMQSPSLPPEIPKRSLAPVWITAGTMVIGGVVLVWWARSPQKEPQLEPSAASAPPVGAAPAPAAPRASAAEPPPPPPPEHQPPPPPPVGAIPAEAAVPAAPGAPAAPARRDPNCDDPCRGKETPELLGSMRVKAGQARSCYERALSNNSALAGRIEVAVRVGANGVACSASVANDTLGDVSVKSCALGRFRGAQYPKPSGGCVDVSVPMNFMPASR
jgi:hypothetical protein